MRVDLLKYNSLNYAPGNVIKRLLWYFVNVIFFLCPFSTSSFLKNKLLRIFGAKVGSNVVIKPSVNIKYPWFLEIGNNVWIGEGVWIDNLIDVVIQDNVCISQGAMLLTGNHNYKKETFDLILGEIVLEEGCWIGAKSTVCPGVKVGSHAVLSVGSVASSNLEPYTIYKSNDCLRIRDRIVE